MSLTTTRPVKSAIVSPSLGSFGPIALYTETRWPVKGRRTTWRGSTDGRTATGTVPGMNDQGEAAERFLQLHHGETPLLLPNPWDIGSAKLLASLGFQALATTSSGFAATLGRLDGSVTREEALAHGGELAAAVDVPVSADTENGFADDPAGVAETVRLAAATGLAGCSVEDYTRNDDDPIYDVGLATERIAAAAEAAHAGPAQ